jgi:hypothetical protein
MSVSEVARLRQQIEAEYIAARYGLYGIAQGTSRHQFITTKMEHIREYQEQLEAIVGQQAAMQIFVETLTQLEEL